MRYIKPPKELSRYSWHLSQEINLEYARDIAGDEWTVMSMARYIIDRGAHEYILDARIFRSEIVKELLS